MEQIIVKKIEKSFVKDNFFLPGSKSITLRDFVLAALAEGESVIRRPAVCDDAKRMREALEELGVKFEPIEDGYKIHGLNGKFATGEKKIWLGASGVSARLLLALAILRNDKTIFDGDESLRVRPQKYLLDCLALLGADINSREDGFLPIEISGAKVIKDQVSMPGDKSSQYFSALMLIAPLLPNGLEISVIGNLVSKPYIDITINEMRKFGVEVENDNYKTFKIRPQKYQAADLTVEGDATAASYFMAVATINGGSITFKNLGSNSKQGDVNFYKICEKLGARVELDKEQLKIIGMTDKILNPLGKVNMEDIPDTAPTLMMIAPLIPSRTKIVGIATLKMKECNRIKSPVTELEKLEVKVEAGDDYVIIDEKKDWDYDIIKNTSIDTYNDHRMAMSFAVLGTVLGNLKINNPNCVEKTYPNFWEELSNLS